MTPGYFYGITSSLVACPRHTWPYMSTGNVDLQAVATFLCIEHGNLAPYQELHASHGHRRLSAIDISEATTTGYVCPATSLSHSLTTAAASITAQLLAPAVSGCLQKLHGRPSTTTQATVPCLASVANHQMAPILAAPATLQLKQLQNNLQRSCRRHGAACGRSVEVPLGSIAAQHSGWTTYSSM